MNVQPSRIARYVAGRTWGHPVQSSRMLSHGVYSFDTPSHGGIVAVVPAVREHAEHGFDPAALAAARATGRIEQVAILVRGERAKLYGPSGEHAPGALAAWAARYGAELCDVWIGEEDCAYAPLLLACKPARVKWNATLGEPEADDAAAVEFLRGVCQRWETDYLEHYDPEGVTA